MGIISGKRCMSNKVARKSEEGVPEQALVGIQRMLHSLTVFKCRRQLEAEIPNLCNPLKLSFECSSQNSGRQRLTAGGGFS